LAVECGIIGGARKNKEEYKKMEFSTLVSRLGDKFGLEMDGSLGAAGLEIDGVAVILQLAGGPRGDILFTHADLGLPPSERYDAVVGAVLEANFLYQGTGGASFAINPADGHLHLQRYDWLERLDVDDTLAMLQRFSETISSWKSIMADVQQAAADQASASDSGEQAVSGGFMQV
jgi:hypothetical protein